MVCLVKSRLAWLVNILMIVFLCSLFAAETEIHAKKSSVYFESTKLERIVRSALQKPEGAITPEDMAKLNAVAGYGVTSMKGLEYAVNLKELRMMNGEISDLSPISGLRQLQNIALNDNNISDLSPLRDLANVEHLDLSLNKITDLEPLQSMETLRTLKLSVNFITNPMPLNALRKLESLELNDNFIPDFSGLHDLTRLEYLDVTGNLITDLSPFRHLEALYSLDVTNNKVKDLTPVRELKLLAIEISNTDITDLSPLEEMSTLKVIYGVNTLRLNERSQAFIKRFVATEGNAVFPDSSYSSPKVFINQEVQQFPVRPVQYNGRVMVPLRGLLEWIGAEFEWDGKAKQVILSYKGSKIILTIDSDEMFINGKRQRIDAKPYIEDGYTMVPIRFIVESFGFHLDWDSKRRWVMLTTE
ncbi:hypothetical protein D3P08_03425 [Paenibacillus nanensis]|uniref:Copper amine oxidase-like N-terminal domain-containing protein n=1 Tax=Paenibacillus nanensis TaxID=393251 RepID=A0A3A1VE86_9BACL|nr:stalk domain-containing protein [Paenibacillus nanensis]RIX59219.1 hypothetical protein D3P08_03425 [Paenibacillus nanensis]